MQVLMNYWGNRRGKTAYFFIVFPQSSRKPFSIVLQLRNGSKEKSYASFFYEATCVISNGKFFLFKKKEINLFDFHPWFPSEQQNSAFIAIASCLLSIAFRMFTLYLFEPASFNYTCMYVCCLFCCMACVVIQDIEACQLLLFHNLFLVGLPFETFLVVFRCILSIFFLNGRMFILIH